MKGSCSTGQRPQWAVVPVEEGGSWTIKSLNKLFSHWCVLSFSDTSYPYFKISLTSLLVGKCRLSRVTRGSDDTYILPPKNVFVCCFVQPTIGMVSFLLLLIDGNAWACWYTKYLFVHISCRNGNLSECWTVAVIAAMFSSLSLIFVRRIATLND
jgi:hypothetical protein